VKNLTTKHILNKVNIDITSYIILLLSFLAGYFEIVFLTILSIIIHELGHLITAVSLNLKVKRVDIYMFGGVTILDENLSLNIKKEILTLIMGPITELLFVMLIYILYKNGLVGEATYEKLYKINKMLLTFNLLPILPLDGGKLLNNILDLYIPYNISHLVSVITSIIALPCILYLFGNKIFTIIILIFLINKNIEEIKTHKYRVNKLIMERRLKYSKYKKKVKINKLKNIYRNANFIIKYNDLMLNEKDYFKLYNYT